MPDVDPLLSFGLKLPFSLLMQTRFRWQIEGREHIPTAGPLLVAANHTSRWDALVVRYLLDRDARFLASADEFHGLQGWLMDRLGALPVDVRAPGTESLRRALEVLRQDKTLVIFPEGNIFEDGALHPLKSGVGRLAMLAPETQVLPVAICYQQGRRWGSTVQVRVGAPLAAAHYTGTGSNSRQAATRLTAALAERLQALRTDEPALLSPVA